MEALVNPDPSFWQGLPVFLTGHTGFKGGWLSVWLHALGAEVHGYSLPPLDTPNLFGSANIPQTLASHQLGDIRDLPALTEALQTASPQIVFHLAAQPLVRESYKDPLGTLTTNVTGTANLLEAVRRTPSVRAVVVVTTDKVYENREWAHPYREIDPLGGRDPYSASKAAAEIVTASWRDSFFSGPSGHPARVATARAGNVIGGGDWAPGRLVPDCLKAFSEGRSVELRFPGSTRPWQHVLEPLSGYLALATALLRPDGDRFAAAWNFGPDVSGNATVLEVARRIASHFPSGASVTCAPSASAPHEAGLLALDSSRARKELAWQPRWPLDEALRKTVEWHHAWTAGRDMLDITRSQIGSYLSSREP